MKRFQMITEADARVIEYGSTVTLVIDVSGPPAGIAEGAMAKVGVLATALRRQVVVEVTAAA